MKVLGARCVVLTGALVNGLACLITRLGGQAEISILASAPRCPSGMMGQYQRIQGRYGARNWPVPYQCSPELGLLVSVLA